MEGREQRKRRRRRPGRVDPVGRACENDNMRTLWRKVRVAHAWLTAAALLVAAAPHFRCVCPDGRVKPFCLAVPSGPSGCCCGGTCCHGGQGGACCRGG